MNRSMSETENIRLGQYLKLLGLAATGGEAKILIQDGYVRVNGEVETRRKRQLQDGDKVEVGEYVSIVQYGPDPEEPTDEPA
jgi:ribosome-associated protein